MTTIVYRAGVMAADTRTTRKDVIDDDNTQKIWRLQNRNLFGGSGDYNAVLMLLSWLRESVKLEKKKQRITLPTHKIKCEALLYDPKYKELFYYDKGYWEFCKGKEFYAIGSGAPYAMVAMEYGASAEEAVKAAMGKDIYSGGRVRSLHE